MPKKGSSFNCLGVEAVCNVMLILQVAKTIKHSRNLGMLPHLGEFQRHDANPLVNESKYHKEVKGVKKVTSNTILK